MLALCLASAGSASAAGALTWTAPLNVDAARTIETIDCPTPSFCLAGDQSGFVVASSDPANAASWIATQLGLGFISDVSCPSTALCLAVDGPNVWWSTDPGAALPTWSSANVTGGLQLETLDCPSTTLCLAGTESGGRMYSTVTPTNPLSWTPVVIDAARGIFSLDCPTTTFCVAGHDAAGAPPGAGVYITTNPTTAVPGDWVNTDGFNIDPVNSGTVTTGMSCPTVSFCVGSDDFGNVMPSADPTGGTAAWSAPHLANFPVFLNISCPTTRLCVTGAGATSYTSVDPTGGAATWQTDPFASALRAVSCADATFCVVGGNNGNVYVGTQALLSIAIAGAGTGSVSGSGITCPGTCSSAYPFTTSEVLTATPAAGSVFGGWSGDCSGTDKCNVTMSSDRAVSATFDPAPTAPVVATTSTEPPPTQPPAQPAQALPPPVARKTANTYPASGTVRVKVPGSTKFVPLAQPLQVPFGAVFDTRKGAVRIVIANARGGTDSAVFSQGVFRLVAVGRFAELRLAGGSFRGCPKAARGGAAVARSKRGRRVRHLWGEGSGSFRTKGRFASATIRGTKWLTGDYCRGTLVRVTVGAVTVRNLVTRRARAVKAPRSYFARPR